MEYDLWFCRYDGDLYAIVANPDEPPMSQPRRTASVKEAVKRLKMNGHKIVSIGILPAEMLGME